MFTLTKEQSKKVNDWLSDQIKIMIEKQKANIKENDPSYGTFKLCWDAGYPYTGAIGGSLTYSFTPTSLGTVVRVYYFKGTENEAMIDVSDYESW